MTEARERKQDREKERKKEGEMEGQRKEEVFSKETDIDRYMSGWKGISSISEQITKHFLHLLTYINAISDAFIRTKIDNQAHVGRKI